MWKTPESGEPEVMCRSPSPLSPSAAAASRIAALRRAPYVTSLIGHSSERFNGAFSCAFSRAIAAEFLK
jgi:hypothetical protein